MVEYYPIDGLVPFIIEGFNRFGVYLETQFGYTNIELTKFIAVSKGTLTNNVTGDSEDCISVEAEITAIAFTGVKVDMNVAVALLADTIQCPVYFMHGYGSIASNISHYTQVVPNYTYDAEANIYSGNEIVAAIKKLTS